MKKLIIIFILLSTPTLVYCTDVQTNDVTEKIIETWHAKYVERLSRIEHVYIATCLSLYYESLNSQDGKMLYSDYIKYLGTKLTFDCIFAINAAEILGLRHRIPLNLFDKYIMTYHFEHFTNIWSYRWKNIIRKNFNEKINNNYSSNPYVNNLLFTKLR